MGRSRVLSESPIGRDVIPEIFHNTSVNHVRQCIRLIMTVVTITLLTGFSHPASEGWTGSWVVGFGVAGFGVLGSGVVGFGVVGFDVVLVEADVDAGALVVAAGAVGFGALASGDPSGVQVWDVPKLSAWERLVSMTQDTQRLVSMTQDTQEVGVSFRN